MMHIEPDIGSAPVQIKHRPDNALAGAMSAEHRINQLRYQGDRGTLAVELTTTSLGTLQTLQQRLQSEGGVGVAMENATQDQAGVRARLTLQGRP